MIAIAVAEAGWFPGILRDGTEVAVTRWEQLGLHWTESGQLGADVLVLSNALGSTLDMWEPQMAVLNQRYHVIRYDQRGHGGSTAAGTPFTLADLGHDVMALLDHVQAETAAFMGVGLGGIIGMWLGTQIPSRVSELAICCGSAHPAEIGNWADMASLVRQHGTSEIVSVTVEEWFTPHFREYYALETAEYAAMIASTDDEAYAQCCELLSEVDLREQLARISAPTLVLAGANDPVVDLPQAESIASGIGANARLEVVPHAAHLPTVEQADHVNQLLTAGIAGLIR